MLQLNRRPTRRRLLILLAAPIFWSISTSAQPLHDSQKFCALLNFGSVGRPEKDAVRKRLVFLLGRIQYKSGSKLSFAMTCPDPDVEFIVSKAELTPNDQDSISYTSRIVIRKYGVFLNSDRPSAKLTVGKRGIEALNTKDPDYIIYSALWASYSKKNGIHKSPIFERMRNDICTNAEHTDAGIFSRDVIDC
jgi:hypothetical protein